MAALGETTYLTRNVNGNDTYSAIPYGGNIPFGYTNIGKDAYITGLQGKISQAQDYLTKSTQPGYVPQAGPTYTQGDVSNFQNQINQVQNGQGIHAPGYVDKSINVNPADFKPFTGSPSDFVNPQQQQQAEQNRINQGIVPSSSFNAQKIQEGYQNAKNAGITSPSDYTGANTMFNQFLSPQQTPSAVDNFVSQDPYLNATISAFQQQMSQQNQRTSLVDTYKSMLQESGIQGIDTELINMKNVIEGTEDDIRTEVTKAGGFATDSQVIALSNARNKQLIKNYNTLLETRNAKSQYLDTMMNLTQQDRQAADQRFETQMNFGFKIAEINQQMKQNAISTIDRVAQTLGWDGVFNATQGNPQLQRQIEMIYGLPQGGLAIAAQRDAEIRMIQTQDRTSKQKQQQFENQLDLQKFEEDKRQFGLKYAQDQQNAKLGGLTPSQINTSVNTIAGAFDNESIVKNYNIAQEGYKTISSIGVNTKSPADDIAFIYAFAKIMDPNSVVREGEYNTIQRYAQNWAQDFQFKAERIFSNTNFLSADAKQKMLNALTPKINTLQSQYDNLYSEYQRQINDAYAGKPRQITQYSQNNQPKPSDNLSDDEAWEAYKKQQGISEPNMPVAPTTNPFTNKRYYQ